MKICFDSVLFIALSFDRHHLTKLFLPIISIIYFLIASIAM